METIKVALKEWQVINDAVLENKQSVLIRKGGILDSVDEFPPDKKEFFIFPTYEHQKKEYVKQEFHYLFRVPSSVVYSESEKPPIKIKINLLCKLKQCIQITDKKQLEEIYPFVIYTMEFLEMRFNYKPKEPLNILVIQPYKLETEKLVDYTEYLRGCKSWITLP